MRGRDRDAQNDDAFGALLHEVCVERGWCGSVVDKEPLHVTDLLPDTGQVTADEFVTCVFRADGVHPDEDWAKWQKHWNGLRDAFVRHLGSDTVDAGRLTWP
jgi:hypothetical protein